VPLISAQLFDLGRQARIAADVEGFDLGQAAIDFAQVALHLAGGPGRGLAHALPELLFLPIDIELRRLFFSASSPAMK